MTDPWPFCANDGTCSCAKFGADPEGCERRDGRFNSFAHAAANARPDCPKCKGTGEYMYDHSHGTICDLCCRHDRGWWQLTDVHGASKAGKWCCRAGCGYIVDTKPEETTH